MAFGAEVQDSDLPTSDGLAGESSSSYDDVNPNGSCVGMSVSKIDGTSLFDGGAASKEQQLKEMTVIQNSSPTAK
ncbi:unnamed protein product [Sphagnum balticum]